MNGALGATACTVTAVAAVLMLGLALRPMLVGTVRTVVPDRASNRHHASRRWVKPALGVVAVVCALGVCGPLLTAAALGGVWAFERARPVLTARARQHNIERELPDALDLLVLSVRAGLTPRQAIEALVEAAPPSIAPACAAVIHRTDRGQTFADSVLALPEVLGPTAGGLADAISSCERYGLPLEPLLDQLSTDARAARRRLADADARKIPVRLAFPLVACTLPSFVLLGIAPAVIAALSSLGVPSR